MAKTAAAAPQDKVDLYDALINTHEHAERKGAKMPYTSMNGHMFSFLPESGIMALRLSPDDREAFIAKYGTALAEQHGRVMKEYASVPNALLEDTAALSPYFGLSYAYVSRLKPKPTKKKK